MNNSKATSSSVASEAARILKNSTASATAKSLAGSALSQRSSTNQTCASMEDLASKVLNSPKYSQETKTLAGSILSQSNKQR
jgi:hypothetical protein